MEDGSDGRVDQSHASNAVGTEGDPRPDLREGRGRLVDVSGNASTTETDG